MNKTKIKTAKAVIGRDERLTLSETRSMAYEKFRTNVRLLRAKTGISAVETGDSMGLKNGKRLIDLEYGRANPTMEEMIIISKYFSVEIDSLLNKEASIIFN